MLGCQSWVGLVFPSITRVWKATTWWELWPILDLATVADHSLWADARHRLAQRGVSTTEPTLPCLQFQILTRKRHHCEIARACKAVAVRLPKPEEHADELPRLEEQSLSDTWPDASEGSEANLLLLHRLALEVEPLLWRGHGEEVTAWLRRIQYFLQRL